ncbi:MAG: helix-turn-helix transcriptional regulator [Alphaproteobacteria bacterium]
MKLSRHDRLSALFSHFSLSVSPAPAGARNLIVLGGADGVDRFSPHRVVFYPHRHAPDLKADAPFLLGLQADFGGLANPLMSALPEELSLLAENDGETELLLRLLLAEARAERCGFGSVLSRLAEVLIIRLLRHEIERGATEAGLLAGLADSRLSRCIVALHDTPERDWRNDELASIAGLSLSRFAQLFRVKLNLSPQAYLRRWRMTLARQDIARGDRIKAIARRYGYGSSEAFAKAFHRQFGSNPMTMRHERPESAASGRAAAAVSR